MRRTNDRQIASPGLRAALGVVLLALAQATAAASSSANDSQGDWSDAERRVLQSLSLDALPPRPSSPGNPVADDPEAIAFGHRLFFDTRLGSSDAVSCATCHQAERGFRDGLPRGRAIGETRRRTMSLVGAAWSPWLFWDGRRDSLWAQALEPLEDPAEHGGTRLQYLHLIADDAPYRKRYEALFGALPDTRDMQRFPLSGSPRGTAEERASWNAMAPADRRVASTVFANLGRAIAAYERQLAFGPSAFDEYVRALERDDASAANRAMSEQAIAGLGLFIGKARCTHCHNGPLFTNNEFHNTGVFPADRLPDDRGRVEGVKALLEDEFNCLGPYSGADPASCGELRFIKKSGLELVAAFRTPSLRNIAASGGPYMHNGDFPTLRSVLEHYNEARATLISDDLEPLGLSDAQFAELEAFLRALDGPLSTEPSLLSAPGD